MELRHASTRQIACGPKENHHTEFGSGAAAKARFWGIWRIECNLFFPNRSASAIPAGALDLCMHLKIQESRVYRDADHLCGMFLRWILRPGRWKPESRKKTIKGAFGFEKQHAENEYSQTPIHLHGDHDVVKLVPLTKSWGMALQQGLKASPYRVGYGAVAENSPPLSRLLITLWRILGTAISVRLNWGRITEFHTLYYRYLKIRQVCPQSTNPIQMVATAAERRPSGSILCRGCAVIGLKAFSISTLN